MRSSTLLAALLAATAPSFASPTSPKPASLIEERSSGTLSVWRLATPLCDNGTPADRRWISPAADCLEYRDASGASQPVHAVRWLGGRFTVSVYTKYGCAGMSDSALQAAICWDSPGAEIRSFRVQC